MAGLVLFRSRMTYRASLDGGYDYMAGHVIASPRSS